MGKEFKISTLFLGKNSKETGVKICKFLIEASILGIVFFVPISFSFFKDSFNIFELNKLVVFRILLTICFLAWWIKITILEEIRYKFKNILLFLVFFLFALFLLSSFFSIHPLQSFWGKYSRGQGFFALGFYLIFFLLLILNLKTKEQIKRILWAVLFSSFFVSFYGLLQYFALDPLSWTEEPIISGRIFSSLGQPNFLGHFLIMVIPLTVYSLVFLVKRAVPRFLILVLLVFQISSLIFTYSRSAWLGFLVSFFFFGLFFCVVKKYKKTLMVIVLLIILFSIATPMLVKNLSSEVSGRDLFDFQSGSVKMRLLYWRSSWDEFKEADLFRKTFGFGPDTEASLSPSWIEPEWAVHESLNLWPDRAHNLILDQLLGFGFLGFLFILILFGYLLRETVKYFKRTTKKGEEYWLAAFCLCSLISYFINNLFSFSLTTHYIYLYLILAILTFIIFSNREENVVKITFRKIFKIFISILLFSLSFVFVLSYNVYVRQADHIYMVAKKYEIRGNCWASLSLNEKAIRASYIYDNFYKKRYIERGSECLDFFMIEEADIVRKNVSYFIDSVPEIERDFSFKLSEARASALMANNFNKSYFLKAEEKYSSLLADYPNISPVYLGYGFLKIKKGEFKEAANILERGLATLPDINSSYSSQKHKDRVKLEFIRFWDLLGKAYKGQGDMDRALSYYQKIIRTNPYEHATYKEIADAYYQEKNLDKALWYNKRGYMLNRNDYVWPLGLAILSEEMGEEEEAKKYAKEALDLSFGKKDISNFLRERFNLE